MKLASWNVNGIRSVYQKGFDKWFRDLDADFVCLQEVKAHCGDLEEALVRPKGFFGHWHCAEKKGYSGLAVYAKKEPLSVHEGLGDPQFDREGRALILEYPDFTLINSYFPNSQRDHARLDYKLAFCEAMLQRLNAIRAAGKNVLLCGDFNIAHKEIDLKNPKENKDNAGFLPEERAWMDKVVEQGYLDTFRLFQPAGGHYTWWSYRPTIRERNIGWRLDYFLANGEMRDRLRKVEHQTQVMGSDHCPVLLELKS